MQNPILGALRASCFAAVLVLSASAAYGVTIDWVEVGDPGNPADTEVMTTDATTGYGAVADVYLISKHETTNAQYAEFLNAVADTDTYGLYNMNMSMGSWITRSGSSGSYTYSAITAREDTPVNFVSWYDALRFANWLHNGQPTGAQDATTTEDGAYTFSGATSVGTRNADATIFLTSEDEWYKAAYYDAVSTSYFDYPAGSDTQTGCVVPSGDTGNSANCGGLFSDPDVGTYLLATDVGAYGLSESPYGTFDQGGNRWEWNEAIVGSDRGVRGGGFLSIPDWLAASIRGSNDPTDESNHLGFRVAMIPEPSTGLLLTAGLLGLALRRRLSA
jgi:formylglycine-generating enzyme required for sulfatase activity